MKIAAFVKMRDSVGFCKTDPVRVCSKESIVLGAAIYTNSRGPCAPAHGPGTAGPVCRVPDYGRHIASLLFLDAARIDASRARHQRASPKSMSDPDGHHVNDL